MNNTGTTFIKDLAVGDVFSITDRPTRYVAELVRSSTDGTVVEYRTLTEDPVRGQFHRVNLATVFVYA